MTKRRFRADEIESLGTSAGLECLYCGYFTFAAFPIALALAWWDRIRGLDKADPSPGDGTMPIDLRMPPGWLNSIFYGIASLENRVIASGVRFPFGIEVVGVFRKP
jgi:hypothetical protein